MKAMTNASKKRVKIFLAMLMPTGTRWQAFQTANAGRLPIAKWADLNSYSSRGPSILFLRWNMIIVDVAMTKKDRRSRFHRINDVTWYRYQFTIWYKSIDLLRCYYLQFFLVFDVSIIFIFHFFFFLRNEM